MTDITHNENEHRYELHVDDALAAVAEYTPSGGRLDFHHTYTEPAFRGRGLAARVVKAALDDTRSHDGKIVASCWFVADFIEAHPEYEDLLA